MVSPLHCELPKKNKQQLVAPVAVTIGTGPCSADVDCCSMLLCLYSHFGVDRRSILQKERTHTIGIELKV